MIILIVLIYTTHQTVIYEFNANSNNRDEWQDRYGNCNFNACGGIQYFGTPNDQYLQLQQNIFRSRASFSYYGGGTVYKVVIIVNYKRINHDNAPLVQLDQQSTSYQSVISTQNTICGNIKLNSISITHQHNRRTVWIDIYFYNAGGLISFKLSILKCQYECAGCIENSHTFCLQWKLHQYSFNQKSITNTDGWTFESYSYYTYFYCGNCQFLKFKKLKYSTQLPPHQDVLIRFFKLDGTTIILDYLYGNQTISSQYNQQFDSFGNDDLNHNDPILVLKIITENPTVYSYIRDFEVFYTQPEIIFNNLNEGCLEQINNSCLICQEGWIQDEFLENCYPIYGDGIIQGYATQDIQIRNFQVFQTQLKILFNNLNEGCLEQIEDKCLICQEGWIQDEFLENCRPICGDGIIQGQEQCDDTNLISSCYLCKYSCINYCKSCQFGICQQCIDGFLLSLNRQYCMPICNDGIIQQQEICDDENNIQFDGCYKCQLNCHFSCQICIDQKCYLCENGWELRDNQCYSNCGDGLIALHSIEQCDDANQIQNDGCFNCQLECIPYCPSCLNNDVCFICQDHFQLEGQSCLPICGDEIIITGLEDCDDGNNEPNDGCNQCQYECSQGCLDCENGQGCKQCDNQYILNNETAQCQEIKSLDDQNKNEDENTFNILCSKNFILIDYQCINQCGNGILNLLYEQCDDGNLIGGDGCSFFCSEEDSYQCLNHQGSMSMCSYILPPDFILNRLSNQQNQTQVIELRFTQKVKLLGDLSFEDIAAVFLIPKTNAAINIKPIVKLSTTFDHPIYQIFVEFIEPVKDPVLQIDFAQLILQNEQDLDLMKNQMQISLGNPFVLSETTQKKVTSIVLLNDGMIYSMISISGLSLLTGNAIMFLNMLDLLQSLSYIKFMQYQFPPHLIQFLNTFTKVSLKPILDYIRIDEILTSLNGGSLPFQSKKSDQNLLNPLNQFYLLNAKGCYLSIIVSLITYLICRLITSQKIETLHRSLFQKFYKNYKYLLIDNFFSDKLQKYCTKYKNEYFSLGIFKVYLAILHQFLFSALLQFPDYSFNSPLMAFNSINAIIGLVLIVYISLQLLSITSSNKRDKTKWLYFYQDSKPQFWAANYRSFQIYRIMFYIFTIVVALNYPQIQSILLSMSSFFYLGYLIKFKPIQSMYEYAKLISREFLFILITGSFLIYSFEFDENQLLLYGWIHIALFTLMLISNLIIDLIECINKALINYQRKQDLEKIKEIKRFYNNPLQKFIQADLNQQKL